MQLTHHQYSAKPDRYFIDGKRVSYDAYDLAGIKARIGGDQICCFITRRRTAPPGQEHYVHTHQIYERTRP